MAIENSLKIAGEAFLLARPGTHHGRNTLEMTIDNLKNSSAEIFENVRGTEVIRIVKKG